MVEILSPVGNRDMLIAAVRSGADAVYLGAPDFNARRNATNFSYDELREVVEYCHERYVLVYLTLNTLLYNTELKKVAELVKTAAEIHIDGIICADLGAAKIVKEVAPFMPLHASTQMTVHTPEAIPVLRELGFSRVVPSREMSKCELEKFVKKAHEYGMEVEVFVHGALCMSMSGQCLMSAYLGGRSGNRGLCAGPCRLPFSCKNQEDYALSLKDMSYIKHIKELEKIGVNSLKIEGRMKTAEYVSAATKACRDMIDKGELDAHLWQLLGDVFSRSGFTDGYYTESMGEGMFGIRTDEQLTLSKNVQNEIHEFYRNERSAHNVFATVYAAVNTPIKLTLSDGCHTVEVVGEKPQAAKTKPIDQNYLFTAFSKLGGTPYKLNKLEAEISDGLSVPMSHLNQLRRHAVEELTKKRLKTTDGNLGSVVLPKPKKRTSTAIEIYCRFESVQNIPKNLSGVTALILPIEQLKNYEGELPIIAHLPRGLSNLKNIESLILDNKQNFDSIVVENLATLEIAKKHNIPFIIGTGQNVMNALANEVYLKMGAKKTILSLEAKISECEYFSGEIGVVAYGKVPLMLTRNCPISSSVGCKQCGNKITDRKGVEFPVFCRAGYSEIFNSRPIVLSDRKDELMKLDFIVLNFLDETEKEVQTVIENYKTGSAKTGEYTRGLNFRGVL